MSADVAIVGFGPVGAVLAGLLGKRGLRVVVVDREADVYPLPRAAHIDHQSLRVLQELGVLWSVLPRMIINPGVDFVNAERRVLLSIPSDQPSVSGLPTSMYFHQPSFDRALRGAVAGMPNVTVLLSTTATGLQTEAGCVSLLVGDTGFGDNGERWVRPGPVREISAKWVVGCDGARSFVRETCAINQESLNFDQQWLVVDLLLQAGVNDLPDRAHAVCDPRRPMFVIPMPEQRFRVELMLLPEDDPVEIRRPERVEELISQWIPRGASSIERAAIYEFHGLVSARWRAGRVLLAGDAAHLMPPFLGQGMNSGIRDAANLAWKLGLVVQRSAPKSLMDTYQRERRPHVRQIVTAAVELGHILCERDPVAAAERDRQLLDSGLSPAQRRRFGLPRLAAGPLVGRHGGQLFPQPGFDPGRGLDDVIGSRFFVLGRTRGALGSTAAWWSTALDAFVTTLAELPEHAAWLARWLDRYSANVVVVRPDRYVLAVGRRLDPISASVEALLASEPILSHQSVV